MCSVFFLFCIYFSAVCAGIEPVGNRVMSPAVFTVDAFSAGQGQVTVYIEDPEGTREEVSSTMSCFFIDVIHTPFSLHLISIGLYVHRLYGLYVYRLYVRLCSTSMFKVGLW